MVRSGSPVACRVVQRSERIHLAIPPGLATTLVRDALTLADDLTGPLPGAPQARLRAEVAADGDASAATLTARNDISVPFFGRLFALVFRFELARGLRWSSEALSAAVRGDPAPAPLRKHPLSTPGHFDQSQTNLIAAVSFAGVVTAFGAALFGQLSDPVAKTFDISDQGLGAALAVTRSGAVVALFAATFADRVGRRRVLLAAIIGVCIASGVSAVAPTFEIFTAAQTFGRACVNAAVVVGGIAVVEEAPEGARAFAVSMLALASGAGYAFSVVLLPIADIGPDAWRIAFGVAAMSVLLVPVIARRLAETSRFEALAARTRERGNIREVMRRGLRAQARAAGRRSDSYRTSSVPRPPGSPTGTSRDERGFSNSGIAAFKGITNGIPGIVGIVLAGRLAESKGRRPVAVVGMLAGNPAHDGVLPRPRSR